MDAIHFFRAGRHTSNDGTEISFSAAQLAEIAASYDPAKHEAPIVVGHPKGDAPAFGWVAKVEARPDGLYAVPRQVNPEFAELVRQGAYKKVSGSFYAPGNPNHPKPGSYYLRHLGFLGAQPPAVKGLRAIELSEAAGAVDFEESVFDLREHSFAERERALQRREIEAEIRRLNKEGRIPIGDVPQLLAFMDSLTPDGVISFSDADGEMVSKPHSEWFMDYLRVRPVMVITKELCGTDFDDSAAPFDLPPHYKVDPNTADTHKQALAHQRDKGGSYADAVRAVSR